MAAPTKANKAQVDVILSRSLHKLAKRYGMLTVGRQRVASKNTAMNTPTQLRPPAYQDVVIKDSAGKKDPTWEKARFNIDKIEAYYNVTRSGTATDANLRAVKRIETAVDNVLGLSASSSSVCCCIFALIAANKSLC